MNNKRKMTLSVIGLVLTSIFLIVSSILAEYEIVSVPLANTLVIVSTILLFVTVFFLCKIDYETGVFECKKCGHTFKPTLGEYICASHIFSTRHLRCPRCEEKSWCQRKPENTHN